MAAIFCQALAKPCEWLAEGCAACCDATTKVCGQMCECCDDLCASIGRCCNECCEGIARCCASCCDQIGLIFSKPFSGVVFLGVLMSLVPFAAIIYFLANGWGATGCAKRLDIWLAVCLACYVLNFFFAIYLFARLSNERWDDPEKNPKYDPRKHEEVNQFSHASHFFLYDPWVCLYITAGIFMIVWGIIGLTWASQSDMCETPSLQKATLAAAIILLCFIGIFVVGCLCSLYSGFITVCMNDCDAFKCLFCYIYYPCCYDHDKVRAKYYGNQNQLVRNNVSPRNNGGGVFGRRAAPQQQQMPRQPIQPIQPPVPYGGAVPVASPVVARPVASPQQNVGGNVYYQPRPAAQPVVQQPAYAAAPVDYMQQHRDAAPVNYQQPYQAGAAQQGLLQPQYQQQQQPAPYQPPAQQFSPVYAQMPVQQSQPQPSPYQQPPQQYAQASPYQQSPQQQQQQHYPEYQEQEGVPHQQPYQPQQYAQDPAANAPGGAPFSGNAPIAQPVAQPLNQPRPAAAQPEQKSAAAKAADGAKAAAASLKQWWGKP